MGFFFSQSIAFCNSPTIFAGTQLQNVFCTEISKGVDTKGIERYGDEVGKCIHVLLRIQTPDLWASHRYKPLFGKPMGVLGFSHC